MYWFDCDMPNTFVCTGIFNNELYKVGDCMTNYSEFKNLNKYQRRLLLIFDEVLDKYFLDCNSLPDEIDWDNIIDLDAFYQTFINQCQWVAHWYDTKINKHDCTFESWPEGSDINTILEAIKELSSKYILDEKSTFKNNKDFFDKVGSHIQYGK